MSTFLSLFTLSHIRGELVRTIRRFPLSSIFIIIVTILSCYMVYEDYLIDKTLSDMLLRIIVTSTMTFLLTVAMTLTLEGRYSKGLVHAVASMMGISFWMLYFFTLAENPFDTTESATLIFMTFFGFSAFLFFAPYSMRLHDPRYSEDSYVRYFYHIAMILLTSSMVGGAIMALGSIALWSIDILLFPIDEVAYGYLASIAFTFIAPFFALARIPLSSHIGKEQGTENVFFIFLVKFVGIPFIAVYFLILYAYTVKVLTDFYNWPQSEVSWLVIGFSVFGYILYIFSHPIGTPDGLIQRVRRYFPFAVIPQVFMLFYAIYLRIAQYDLTMNRYFVVVFGFWLLGISVYYSLAKSTRLVYLPVSLALITLVISIGPWSVYQLPVSRQYDRLIENLETAGILSGSEIIPLQSYESIDPTLSNEIARGIEYVCGFDNCDQIKTLFAKEIETAITKKQSRWTISEAKYQKCIEPSGEKGGCYRDEYSQELSRWEIQNHIYEVIKVRVRYTYGGSYTPEFLYFSLDQNLGSHYPMRLSGYTELIRISSPLAGSPTENTYLSISPKNALGILRVDNTGVETFSLRDFQNTLGQKSTSDNSQLVEYRNIGPDSLQYTYTGKTYDIRIFLESINLPNPAYSGTTSQVRGDSVSGYALIRKK